MSQGQVCLIITYEIKIKEKKGKYLGTQYYILSLINQTHVLLTRLSVYFIIFHAPMPALTRSLKQEGIHTKQGGVQASLV